jgi:hypothetical protein
MIHKKNTNSQKKTNVRLIAHHEKKPPVVVRFTNQLNTVAEPDETFIKAKNTGTDWDIEN